MQLPLTRPKSPPLTRRRSCGDAGKACIKDKGFHERAARQSPGTCRGKGKERKSVEISKSKDDPQDQQQEQEQEQEQEHADN